MVETAAPNCSVWHRVLSDTGGGKDGLLSNILLFIFHDIAELSRSYTVKAVMFVMIRRPPLAEGERHLTVTSRALCVPLSCHPQ